MLLFTVRFVYLLAIHETRLFYSSLLFWQIMFFSISANSTGSTSASFSCSSSMYTKGVLQTIGFKEFIPYLEQFDAANDQKIEAYLQANAYKMPTEGNIHYFFFFFFFFFVSIVHPKKKNSISMCI